MNHKCACRAARAGLAVLVLAGLTSPPAGACTALVMKRPGALLLAKNLDCPVGDGFAFVNKRSVAKVAFGQGQSSPLRWTSKYGSVTFNQFGREFPLGGINEAGLVIEELNAPRSSPSSDRRTALNEFQWVQYHLDCCSTVKEVLKSAPQLRIATLLVPLHYLVADRRGKSAVVEVVDGRTLCYTGDDLPVPVLSNNGYAESVRTLRLHRGFGGERRVPKGPESSERFVRAAALLRETNWPGERSFVDDAFGILKSVAQSDTRWSLVYHISRRLVFFKTRSSLPLKIISLRDLEFACDTPALMLPVLTQTRGDLTARFSAYDRQENRRLLDSVFRQLRDVGELEAALPDDLFRRMAEYPEACLCR